jgi:hypothetical protein
MIQKFISLIATAALAIGCHAEGSLETKTAANAKPDPRDAKIAQLELRLGQTTDQLEELLKTQKGTQTTVAGADEIVTPKGYENPAAQLLKVATKPQRPALPPPGPACGQVGPSVAYVDYYPLALSRENCDGNCTTVHNNTQEWMTIESAGGEKKLICGGFNSILAAGIDPEASTASAVTISLVPPGRTAKWLNDSGEHRFILKFWHRERDNSLKRVGMHVSTPITYPYVYFGTRAEEGMQCDDRNC